METLGHIAKSLTIGALDALQALLSIVKTIRLTGGVSIYTVTHTDLNGLDLRSSNLANNFGNGKVLRVDKSSIRSTNAYAYNEGGVLEFPVIHSDFIGRLYRQDDFIESSSFNFITEEGFLKFEDVLKRRNLNNNNISEYKYLNFQHEDYGVRFLGENLKRVPVPMEISSLYSLPDKNFGIDFHENLSGMGRNFIEVLKGYTKYVDNNINETTEVNKYKKLSPENSISSNGDVNVSLGHIGREYDNERSKDIKKYGRYFFLGNLGSKSGLEKYRLKYNYIDKFPPYDGVKVNGRSYLDYVDIPDYITDLSYLENKPITVISYYGGDRSRVINESLFYKYNSPYAVGNSSDMLSFYSVAKRGLGTYSEIKIESGKGDKGNLVRESTYTELESLNDSTSGKVGKFIGDTGYSRLVHRTNNLFREMKLGTLVNRFHTSSIGLHDYNYDELTTAKSKYGLSRGRNLLSGQENKTNGYSNPYCRVWTAHHQYTKLSRLIRPFSFDGNLMSVADVQSHIESDTELRPNNGGKEHLANNSVLMNNGYIRMSPAHDEDFYDSSMNANIKNFMFSIENLAWRDVNWDSARVSMEQRGPNGGRIMWFPPYNLKFNENVNVEWNSNKFIGRGEQIYTYTNTDRSGTLDFTLLIDHPSIINKWRGTSLTIDDPEERENEILRFFAGCGLLDDTIGPGEGQDDLEGIDTQEIEPKYIGRTRNVALVLFFPNNFSGKDYDGNVTGVIEKLRDYECTSNDQHHWVNEQDEDIMNASLPNDNVDKFSLNKINSTIENDSENVSFVKSMLFGGDDDVEFYGFFDSENGYDNLSSVIKNLNSENGQIFGDIHKNIAIDKIELYGYASSHGITANNNKLNKRRANFLQRALMTACGELTEDMFVESETGIKEVVDVSTDPNDRDINTISAKVARAAYAIFRIKWDEDATTNSSVYESGNTIVQNQNYDNVPDEESLLESIISDNVTLTRTSIVENTYRADNEYLYFANIERDDEVAYKKIVDNIRYFNPAYHSITPEGFNARLTFLHQCTRQGPTVDLSSGRHTANESTNYTKYAGNLSFGRAPYCILRIGDFFNTKICITSLSINYDQGGGIQWDLNPEGIGVQPMFANVSISFNFIGGQDLKGPIERLQNAVTSNYYANASVYDHKADRKGGTPYDVRLNVPDKDTLEGELAPPASSEEFKKTVQNKKEFNIKDLYDNTLSSWL